jgi:hypothetical protein
VLHLKMEPVPALPGPYRPGPGKPEPPEGLSDGPVNKSIRNLGLPGQQDFFQLYPLTYRECWHIADELGYRYQTIVAWVAGRAVINRKAFNWMFEHVILPKYPSVSPELVEELRRQLPDPRPEGPGNKRDHDPHATDKLIEGDDEMPRTQMDESKHQPPVDVSAIITAPWLKALLEVAQLTDEERLELVRTLVA